MTAGILLHALGLVDIVQLGVLWALHLVIGWLYLFISPFFLPRHSEARKKNPFAKKAK